MNYRKIQHISFIKLFIQLPFILIGVLLLMPGCDDSGHRSSRISGACASVQTSCSCSCKKHTRKEQVVSVKKCSDITAQDVKDWLHDFNKAVDSACNKCTLGENAPTIFLSALDKRRLRLCPYLRDFKKNRKAITATLELDETIEFMNDVLDDYKAMIKKASACKKKEQEEIFFDLFDDLDEEGMTSTEHAAMGFVYCWIFKFNRLA